MTKTRWLITLAFALLVSSPNSAFCQQQDERYMREMEKLHRELEKLHAKAPVGNARMAANAREQEKFVRDTRELLEKFSEWSSATLPPEIRSADDATKAIEEYLGKFGDSEVEFVTVPDALDVRYRKAVDEGFALVVTARDKKLLEPAWYDFWSCNPKTQQWEHKRLDCSTNCVVRFIFQ
jgi:hypothetical protein